MSDELNKRSPAEGGTRPGDSIEQEVKEQNNGTNEAKIEGGATEVSSQPNSTASGAKAEGEAESVIAKSADSAAEAAPKPSAKAEAGDAGAEEKPAAGTEAAKPERPARPERKAPAEAAGGAEGVNGEAAAEKPARPAGSAAREARAGTAARPAGARAAAAKKEAEPAEPKPPSPNQPLLDRIAAIIKEQIGEDAVEEAAINEQDHDRPTLSVRPEHWAQTARLLHQNPELKLTYLRNVSGVDYETHMEVDYFLINLVNKQEYEIKVKTDRDNPSVPSATPVWATANWNEREIYDLLGIDFPGHPDLRRIMMPDDWVGHPLRKDYEPYDPEV